MMLWGLLVMEFKTYKLRECADLKTGYAFKSKLFNQEGKGIKLVRGKNITTGSLRWGNDTRYWNEDTTDLAKYFLQEDDIVIGMDGSKVGKNYAVVSKTDLPLLLVQRVASLRAKNILNQKFLYYLIDNQNFIRYVENIKTGTSIPHISGNQILNYEVSIPSIEIQEKIVEIINPLKKKVELNNQMISNLEKMSDVIFKHWFVDFEFPNENGEAYKSSGGEMEQSEWGLIPKGWRIASLAEVCDANQDSKSTNDKWEYINYLDTKNITRNSIKTIQKLETDKDKIPSRAKRVVKENDIVYSTVRPNQHHYGIIKEPKDNMLVSTGFVVLTPKTSYPNDLIYLWLTQNKVTQKLQSIAEQSASTFPSIKPIDVLSIKLLIPLEKELISLSNIIEKNSNLIWKYQRQNQILIQILETLLPKLLSGEIELQDETEVTENVPIP